MTTKFVYDGTFIGYSEFTYFISKYYPARRMPLITFDKGSSNVYIRDGDRDIDYVLQPGETFELTSKIEITGGK